MIYQLKSLNLESKNECSSVTSKIYNAFETMTQEEYDEIPDLIWILFFNLKKFEPTKTHQK